MSKIILGDGLLGTELVKQTGWDYISRKKDGIDFRDIDSYKDHLFGYDEIINCIACTNTYDENKEENWNTNYKGVVDLVDYLTGKDMKLVYFSTDYIYANSKKNASEDDVPVHIGNWYGYSKVISEPYIELRLDKYLILRGTHKPRPFIFDKALISQVGNFDYIDTVVKIYIDLIEGDAQGIYNVGTELKTMYDLARKSRDDVVPTNEKFKDTMPLDVSMDLDKLKKFYEEKK
jgi:dTDP-4-dehydrorhamnose reductase